LLIARQSGPGHPKANVVKIKRADSVEPRRIEVTNDMSDGVTVDGLEDSGEIDARYFLDQ
jgi:hypothetical protein